MSPNLASFFAAIFTSLPEPARLPDFSAAALTCCFAGSAPDTSACAASFDSAPALCGSTTATIRKPTSASPATTSNAILISYLSCPRALAWRTLASPKLRCMVARQIRVSGRVQGVGYRVSLQSEARKHGLCGWVRNRHDGSVEALLQGSLPAIEAVIAWARRG